MSTDWTKLDSNSISSVAYDTDKHLLKVHFNDGDTWAYSDVPFQKFKSLVYAGSSGSYLRNQIIPHHEGIKLHDGAPEELSDSGT